MEVEFPVWVITTKSNRKYFNVRTKEFVTELSPDCAFNTPTEANELLKELAVGYVVKPARKTQSIYETRIWGVAS